ncbi:MAG TPA: nuclear transport factor 2 family protein [Chthonomonadaceae bacterium]|nr:nuclear transport factor 2 family protein [Chthonomonadaceae bacterium]
MYACTRGNLSNTRSHAWYAAGTIAAVAAVLCAMPAMAQRKDDKNDNRSQPPARNNPPPRSNPAPQPPVMHARREEVRTSPSPTPPARTNTPLTPLTPRRNQTGGQTGSATPLTPRHDQNNVPTTPRTSTGTSSVRRNPPPRTGTTTRIDQIRSGPGVPAGSAPNVGKLRLRATPLTLAHRTFTKTTEGRHYDNGIHLRKGVKVTETWQRRYFPRGTFHFEGYTRSLTASAFISPFGFYFGVCAPYISRERCRVAPPVSVYIDIPIYTGDTCHGYPKLVPSENLLDLNYVEPGLANAVDELREAFGNGNIDALVTLVDPRSQIAVYLRGNYDYSLDANDYLDLTRDAMRNTHTVEFDITRIHQVARNVYTVSGKHLYEDERGEVRKVYVSYVLENINGEWTLTQVGTAPDKIQRL